MRKIHVVDASNIQAHFVLLGKSAAVGFCNAHLHQDANNGQSAIVLNNRFILHECVCQHATAFSKSFVRPLPVTFQDRFCAVTFFGQMLPASRQWMHMSYAAQCCIYGNEQAHLSSSRPSFHTPVHSLLHCLTSDGGRMHSWTSAHPPTA